MQLARTLKRTGICDGWQKTARKWRGAEDSTKNLEICKHERRHLQNIQRAV